MHIGYILAFFSVLSIVVSTLWLQSLGKDFPIYLLLLNSAFWAIIVFNIANIKNSVATHKLILLDFNNWLLMSVCLALGWLLTYLGATVDAMVLLIVAFLANGFFASIYHRLFIKTSFIFVIILAIYWFSRESAGALAAVYGVFTGLLTFLYFRQAAQFAKKHHLEPLQVMSIRFYFLFVLAFILTMLYQPPHALAFSWTAAGLLLGLALLNQILPNFFNLWSLKTISHDKLNFCMSFAPLFTFFCNGFMYHEWSLVMGVLSFLATLSLNYDLFGNLKEKYLTSHA